MYSRTVLDEFRAEPADVDGEVCYAVKANGNAAVAEVKPSDVLEQFVELGDFIT